MFPEYLNGNAFEDYNQAIRTAAQKYRCHLVDLAAMGVEYDCVDGIHPNAMGMQQLAEGWIRGIEEEKKKTTHRKKKRSWTQWLIPVLLGIEAVIVMVLIVLTFKSVYSLTGCVQYLPGHRPKCYCSLRAQQHAARCTEFMLIA